MLNEAMRIGQFIIDAFLHIWPYLLVTIPLAVFVNLSGASKYIKRAFGTRPGIAILMATAVGAFSPFCSCGVIPIIASLLISGVPLAPVMSFWIASPSMDPEIFFLSVGTIGWQLAVWRLGATLVLSLGAGFITHWLVEVGWMDQNILRSQTKRPSRGIRDRLQYGWYYINNKFKSLQPVQFATATVEPGVSGCKACSTPIKAAPAMASSASIQAEILSNIKTMDSAAGPASCCDSKEETETFKGRLFKETASATLMVVKFMALAFLLEGIITLYIPSEWIILALGSGNSLAILTSALMGVPAYTTSLTALPMISGLLNQGMEPAAALAFLIAGPTTTLPAMAAVWPLVVRKVFLLYVSFSLIGAVVAGYVYETVRFLN